MKQCLFIDNPDCDLHNLQEIPEQPFRTKVIRDAVLKEIHTDIIFESLICLMISTPLDADIVWQHAGRVHAKKYIRHLIQQLEGAEKKNNCRLISNNSETAVAKGSYAAIIASVSSVILATQLVHDNIYQRIFCNIRPPGHHACGAKAMGFCILNNVAIAVEYAFTINPDHRICIIDWDNHVGNGTIEMYRNRINVYYISIHGQWRKNYPFTSGDPMYRGKHNNILNISLYTGSGHDDVVVAFQEQIISELYTIDPTLIYISCGFDAHTLDPIGILKYTTDTFQYMTEQIVTFANHSNHNPAIISLLEGGYNETALSECSIAHIRALAEIA